jgi:queuine/archaeosine tRNA-ribosyltransferase
MLVSAYDLHYAGTRKPAEMRARVNQYSDSGGLLMVDSGGYESSWRNDKRWTFDLYQETITEPKADFFFGFDAVPGKSKNEDIRKFRIALKDTIASRRARGSGEFVPILHGSSPKQLLSFLSYFIKNHPDLTDVVAITERDCGRGIFEKVKTIYSVKKLLNEGNDNAVLHLLGCGSPSSLALYSYFGVDMFDSLDWLKFALDERDWVGRDFSYLDVLNCECVACRGSKRNYVERTLLHNLGFYQEFMSRIQGWITNGSLSTILKKRLGFYPEELAN